MKNLENFEQWVNTQVVSIVKEYCQTTGREIGCVDYPTLINESFEWYKDELVKSNSNLEESYN
jgi:hypothetical protein